jgi:surface protein
LDTSNVTNMNYLFLGCSSLVDFPQLNTSNVIYMSGVFDGCTLTSIPNFDTSNVTDMSVLFRNTHIETVDLSNWDTSKVQEMRELVNGSTVKNVIIGDMSKVSGLQMMFQNTPFLESVTMKGAAPAGPFVYTSDMFKSTKPNGKFYYNPEYDYSKIIAALPET